MSKSKLLLGASVSAIVFAGSPAFAQEAAPQQEAAPAAPAETAAAPDDGAIIVTGIRGSLRSARDRKKNAEQVVDSITAQDIGALPDRSVSEALQRIPGITLQRTNEARDPARLSAEGGAVFIRGLSWVRSEFNGRDTFSANNGRSLSFEDVPADLLAGVDVYKNPTADLVEGGVGGLVNLRTRKPFDQKGQLVAASADYNYADLRKKGFASFNGLYSNRWNTGIGELGILFSGSLNNIGNRTDSVQTGDYTQRTNGGSTVYVPNTLGFRRIDWKQRRIALDGAIQWKPVDNLLITAEAIYAKATPQDIEYNVGDYAGPLPNSDASYEFDDRGVLQSGTVAGRMLDLNTRYGKRVNKTRDLSLNVKWDVNERLVVSGDVQRIRSSMDLESMTAFVEPEDPYTVDFDLSSDTPTLTYSAPGDPQLDQSQYWWAAAMDHNEKNDANQWAYRADAEYDFDGSPFLKSFKFGVRATDREAISRSTSWNWSLLSRQHWGAGFMPAVYLDEQGNPANSGLPNQSSLFGFNNFFRGNVDQPGGFWFPTADLVSQGSANSYEYLRSTLSNGWGWTNLPEDTYTSINDQKEKTLAGYGVLRFGSDQSALRFDGNIGLRVVQTKVNAGDPAITIGAVTVPPVATCVTQAAAAGVSGTICDPLRNLYAFIGTGTAPVLNEVLPTKQDYTNVLPTANLRFFLQDNMFLRFAAGQSMVRPTFMQIQPVFNVGFNFDSLTGFPSGCNITGSTYTCPNPFRGNGANPTLKPIKSTNFDMSWEYYFGRDGQLSAALFYKRAKDFIFAGSERVPITANGQTLEFDLATVFNGEKGTLRGFEFAYQQFYDFLPGALDGFGLGANLTYIKSKGIPNSVANPNDANQVAGANDPALPLEGLSKWSYNVTLMYAKYGIDARLAYNWRSKFLLTTSAANINRPVWSEDYGQLDGSIFYNLNKNIKLGVQGTNLLASRTFLDVGGADLHPRYSWNVSDRRFAFVARAQF
jgi:TonB-dependent receptor